MSFHEMLLRRWRLRGAAPEEEVEEEEEAEEVEEDDDDDEDEDDDEEEDDDDDWSFPAAPAAPAAAAASVAAVAVAAAAAAAAAASSSTGAPRLVPLGEGEEEESAIGVTALRVVQTLFLIILDTRDTFYSKFKSYFFIIITSDRVLTALRLR
jgi:hypothetical protein